MHRSFISLVPIMFWFNFFYGQELPGIMPPSPSAFELTKYGSVQINESRGKLTHTVPIHTFTSGRLQLPINLSYAGDGVKVDQLSSWTGINWILNAGGVITRIVRDRPDEMGNRLLYSFNELETMTKTINGIRDINLIESSSVHDTQADQFSFSFASYSGSFFLDKNLEPRLATYDTELKIEFLGGVQNISNQVIIITDPQGVRYYFGGSGATEQTRLDFTNSSSGGLLPTTAYYLYKITNLLGDQINLVYGSEPNPYNIKLSKIQSVTASSDNNNPTYTSFNGTMFNKIYNGKYLSRITSNRSDFEIHLNSTAVINENYNRVLNEIKIVKSNMSAYEDFKKFSLSYISKGPLSNSTRFFLEKIDFIDSQGIKEYDHHFEYNDIASLPDRLSFSKDYFGYYNGTSNLSDLPKNNYPFLQSVPGFYLANREPDFRYASLGTLTKIHYPTGGYTNVEYEAAKRKKDLRPTGYMDVYCNLSQMNPSAYPVPDTQLTKTFYIGEGMDNMPLPSEDQQMEVNINAVAQGSINHHYKIKVKVENIYNLSSPVQTQSFDLEYEVYSYTKKFSFNLLKENSYIVTLELLLPPSTPNPAPVDVDMSFGYTGGVEIVDGSGVRVKKITDVPEVGSSNIKRYYYQKIVDIGDHSKIPYGTDLSSGFISSHRGYKIYPQLNGWADHEISVATLRSDPVYSDYFSNGPFYKVVAISYGGDSFENGGVQKEFRYMGNSTGINFLSAIDVSDLRDTHIMESQTENTEVFDGKLMSESYFKSNNGLLFMTQRTDNAYSHDTNESVTNLAIKRLHDRAMLVSTDILDGLHMGLFKTYINKFNIISQVTKDYIDHVPISDLDNADNYEHVSVHKAFEYNNYVGLPKKTVESTSAINHIIESVKLYPDDVSSDSSLGYDILTPSQFNAIKKMQRPTTNNSTGLHQIASPIQVETTLRDEFNNVLSHSVQRTNYSEPYPGLVLPKDIQVLKGTYKPNAPNKNILEDRIIYHSYYPNGNVREVSRADGIKTTYIWGYNGQYPIARIEGASFGDLPSGVYSSIVSASNSDVDGIGEDALLGELAKLRSTDDCPGLSGALVTTYTYDPLVGMTSITDTRGHTVYYDYDGFNRLEQVRDAFGNILSRNEYHYKDSD